MTIRL